MSNPAEKYHARRDAEYGRRRALTPEFSDGGHFCAPRCFHEINNGSEGGTRTPMGCPTRPSNVRVYQFHHFGIKIQVEVEVENWFSLTLSSTCSSLFLHHRLFCGDIGEPAFVPAVPAVDNVEERRLKLFRDRSRYALADKPVVHVPDGCDLRRRAGKERFVRYVEVVPRETLFHEPQSALAGHLYNGVPCDPLEDRGKRGGLDKTVPHGENVLSASFGHVSLGIEQYS